MPRIILSPSFSTGEGEFVGREPLPDGSMRVNRIEVTVLSAA